MSSPSVLVIGGLSVAQIHLVNQVPGPGGVAVANDSLQELGGRGGNIAISTYRGAHAKPNTKSGLIEDDSPHHGEHEECVDVRLIAAAANQEYFEDFSQRMKQNGVDPSGIEILPRLTEDEGGDKAKQGKRVEQDFTTCVMDAKAGMTTQIVGFDASSQWPSSRFQDIDRICGERRPDLVIITMEMKKKIVELIIEIVHAAGIDILLYASPGETISLEHYQKLTHMIVNENGAAKMLGYDASEVNKTKWAEICGSFFQKGVKNVVLKVGPLGAYYKDEEKEGYASGHKNINEIVDETGASVAFAGTYAAECVRNPENWDIKTATERGNKAHALVVSEIGYDCLPWSDEIDNLELEPLYTSIDDIDRAPRKKKFGWRTRKQ